MFRTHQTRGSTFKPCGPVTMQLPDAWSERRSAAESIWVLVEAGWVNTHLSHTSTSQVRSRQFHALALQLPIGAIGSSLARILLAVKFWSSTSHSALLTWVAPSARSHAPEVGNGTIPLLATHSAVYVSDPDVATFMTSDADDATANSPVGTPLTTAACPDYSTPTGLVFVPVTPQRILDTRSDSRIGYPGAKPTAGAIVPLLTNVAAGAVVLNVTATEATAPGFIQALPTGLGTPGASSNLNVERVGQTIANMVIVPVGPGGVSLYTQSGTHLVVDLLGTFVAPQTTAGRYPGLANPMRVLDTRPDRDIGFTGPKPGAGQSVPFDIAAAGLPPRSETSAAVLNVTIADATAQGFATVYPAGTPRSLSSNVNVERVGQTVPNLMVVPVAQAGAYAANVYTQTGGHVIVDSRVASSCRLFPNGYSTPGWGRPSTGTSATCQVTSARSRSRCRRSPFSLTAYPPTPPRS